MTVHRSHTDSMVRRPRPPPVTCKTPRPLTPKRCTETSAKAPAPDSLKLPPAVLGKAPTAEGPDHPPAARRGEPPAHRPGAPPPLPQDTRLQPGPGRGRQDRRWLGTFWQELPGLRPHPRGRCRSAGPLGCCSRPQGDQRRQHRRHQQVRGQNDDPEPAVPRRLGRLHHGTPPLAVPPQCINATPTCPTNPVLTEEPEAYRLHPRRCPSS